MNFRTADILHDLLGRRFACPGFLSHLHSLPVTMSQKSSLVQDDQSVSKALTLDSRRNQEGEARLLALQRTQREMPGALRAGASAGGAFRPDARGPSIRRPDDVLGGPTRSARATWTRSGTSTRSSGFSPNTTASGAGSLSARRRGAPGREPQRHGRRCEGSRTGAKRPQALPEAGAAPKASAPRSRAFERLLGRGKADVQRPSTL